MPANAEALISAFCSERHTRDEPERRFGSSALRVSGISDGGQGVQWNAWVEWGEYEQMAFAGVNLEGMKYDGWPVGRLIERELKAPAVFDAAKRIVRPERVQVMWYRDAWQAASRPAITEKLIAGSPQLLHTLSPDRWRSMLEEAGQCLGPGYRGRARQKVTVRGQQKVFDVSPHFQFRRAFWPLDAGSIRSWRSALAGIFADLQPLYDLIAARASGAAPLT